MGIINGFVSQKEYIEEALRFFDYGIEIDFEKTPKEELNRIHKCLCHLESIWTVTALEIAQNQEMFRKITHRDERQ